MNGPILWHSRAGKHCLLWWFSLCCVCWLGPLPDALRGQIPDEPTTRPASQAARVQIWVRQLELGLAPARVAAAKSLARLGGEASGATEALIRCLQDQDGDVRLTAAYALGCIQPNLTRALGALEGLFSDPDEHVRYSAQWSSARLAANIESQADEADPRALVRVLEQVAQSMAQHDHQPRHLEAIHGALGRLQRTASSDVTESQAASVHAPVAESSAPVDVSALARSIYAASDLTTRYQIVDQVEQSPDPRALRKLIVEYERLQSDSSVLQYALSQWGAQGMAEVAEAIGKWPNGRLLPAEDARLIALFKPQRSADWQPIMAWALQSEQNVDARVACLHALSQAQLDQAAVGRLTGALARADENWEVRIAMADTLASLGRQASASEPVLIRLLLDTQQESLRSALARALIQVAPDSPDAVRALHQVLRATELDDPFFGELVEQCRPLGPSCQLNLPQYMAGLRHADVGVRLACAKAVGALGLAAVESSPLLIERIVDRDESIAVKDAAAHALSHLGSTGARQLMHELRQRDPAIREHVLRALAITCPTEAELCQRCLEELTNPHSPAQVRVAAAATLGSMGNAATVALSDLLTICDSEAETSLRAACLLAAARIQPTTTRGVVDHYLADSQLLMRASAAFAYHLCGDSRAAFDGLVGLLNGSPSDRVIASVLLDLGPSAEPWLLETACDAKADAEQRLICFRLASEGASPNWQRLLPLIDDIDLGEQFAGCVEGSLPTEPEVTACVLNLMREAQLSPLTRARLARLLEPESLGVGGDAHEDWSGWTLNQPMAVGLLRAADLQTRRPGDNPLAITQRHRDAVVDEPVAAAPSSSSDVTDAVDRWPEVAAPGIEELRPESAQSEQLMAAGADAGLERPRIVEVFYGTNRAQLPRSVELPSLAVELLGTIAGALVTLMLCLLFFWRLGHRGFAALSLIGIGAVASLGYHTVREFHLFEQSRTVEYGGQYQARVELGMCQVSIPPNHQIGMLESPNLFKLEIKPDPEKHLLLTQVEPLGQEAFYENLQSTLQEKGKSILVFIHGYNVSFEDAARRTAQMADDLKYPGAPVFYSWPSQANWYRYSTDRLHVQQSVPQIRQFLLELAERSGAETINLIAHSMGNVGLTEALQTMKSDASQPLFHQLVLAAPDIDANVFKQQIAPNIVSKAQHVTLYTSQTDLALIASRYFNHGARVGDSAAGVPVFPGIDTIDATAVDSSLLGHAYYGSNVSVLMDLGYLLRNQPISARNYLRKVAHAAQPYWAFQATRVSQGSGLLR